MKEFLEKYRNLPESEKEILKLFLIESIRNEEIIEKNKGRKSIRHYEYMKFLEKVLNAIYSEFKEQWIPENKINDIDEYEFFNYMLWVNDSKERFCNIFFNKNDLTFTIKRNFLDFLDSLGLIKIADFNIIKEFELLEKEKDSSIYPILTDFKNSHTQKYGKKFWDTSKLHWKEKELEIFSYQKGTLAELLKFIKLEEIKKFSFLRWTLYYGSKIIYTPKRDSDRSIFLELIFSKPIKTYFSMKNILNTLENWNWTPLTDKETKRIYNIKDKINNKVKEEIKIKNLKLFSFWEWDNKGKICRNF